jgi:hypothetical protein
MADELKGEIVRRHSGHQQMPVITASVAYLDLTIFRLSGRLFGQKDDITAPAPKNAPREVLCDTLKPLMHLRAHSPNRRLKTHN